MSASRAIVAGARLGLRHSFQYRGEVVVQLFSTGAMCVLIATLWARASAEWAAPAVLGQVAASVFTSRVNEELGLKIRDGTLAADLTRPLPVALQLYSRDLGRALGALVLVGGPMLAVAVAVGVVPGVTDPLRLTAWVLSLVLAHLLNFAISFGVGAATVWFHHIFGLQQVKATLVGLLSGMLIPLAALPDNVRPWVERLPFWVLAAGPARVWTGDYGVLLAQLGWGVVLWGAGLGVWAAARRRLTVVGG